MIERLRLRVTGNRVCSQAGEPGCRMENAVIMHISAQRAAFQFMFLLGLAAAVVGLADDGDVVLIDGSAGTAPALVPLPGIQTSLTTLGAGNGLAARTRIEFAKDGEERRFLAFECVPTMDLAGMQAAQMLCRVDALARGTVRPALLFYEKCGGAWFRIANPIEPSKQLAEARISLRSPSQAAFSQDASGAFELEHVERVWIGVVIDGQATGALELAHAALTSRPFRPSKPVSLIALRNSAWSVSSDAAVKKTLSCPPEGPDGGACVRLDFTFPGGRHMYVVPAQTAPQVEISAYEGIRLTYKASLPPGINGLLLMLCEEGGAQYYADPAPSASADWTSLTVPFTAFKKASWTKDANEQLDLDRIARVCVGAHGAATGKGGDGCILLSGLDFVPPAAE